MRTLFATYKCLASRPSGRPAPAWIGQIEVGDVVDYCV
jgi:hypothetical protein